MSYELAGFAVRVDLWDCGPGCQSEWLMLKLAALASHWIEMLPSEGIERTLPW